MPSPPQIRSIKIETYYNSKRPNIPFMEEFKIDSELHKYYYVIIYGGTINSLAVAKNSTELKQLAIDKFIEHYVPFLYPFVAGVQTAAQETAFQSQYMSVRGGIEANLSALNLRKSTIPALPIPGVSPVFNQSRILFVTSHEFGSNNFNNSMGLDAFYDDMQMPSTIESVTNIKLSTLPMEQSNLSSFMASLEQQAQNFPGQLELNLNFNFLQTGVEKILQILIGQLTDFINFRGINGAFSSEDTLDIHFNGNNQILSISATIAAWGTDPVPLDIGFITNSKYNNYFKDPLVLSTLKNYESINENNQRSTELGEQSSMLGFLQSLANDGAGSSAGSVLNFNGPHTPDNALGPYNNIFASREGEDLADIRDINNIRKILSTFKTSEEIQKIDRYAADPRVRKMALQTEKAKRINAAIAITDVIDKALKFEFPMAGLNDTKAGRVINQILNQFGIQELAKEAIICLTAGTTVSLARISSAVKQELMTMTSSPRYTAPSRPTNVLERPTLGDFKVYFSITGDPPIGQQILDIILKALANGAFEIIKGIADMVKFNCGKIFEADVGALDAGVELAAAMPIAEMNIPNLSDIIANLDNKAGIPAGGTFDYLSDVSKILSPDEICKLFNSPGDVSQDTLDKIVEFNNIYPYGTVSQVMVTYNPILSYFVGIAEFIDTTSLCNEYIDSVAGRLGDCTICFDEGILAQNPAIAELAGIIEDGIEVIIPDPDFLCPENPNYIANPIAETIIPNLFYTLVETIQLQVGASIEGVRTSMLEPVLTTQTNLELSGAMNAVGISMPPYGAAQQPEDGDGFDPSVLNDIADIFDKISNSLNDMDDTEICPDLDLSKIPNMQIILDNIAVVAGLASTALSASAEAAEEISDKLDAIQSGSGAPGGHPFTTYRFPVDYKDRFQQAVGPMVFSYDNTSISGKNIWEGIPGGPILSS